MGSARLHHCKFANRNCKLAIHMTRRNGQQEGVDPSWDDLRFLESLDRLGSATAASRELGVAPSTLYRRIAALEEASGVVCYSQREGGVTRVGRELAELARKTRSSLVRVLRHANEVKGEIKGKVTLTTLDGFAPLLTEPLARLGELHPELEIVLDVSPRGSSIRKGEADIALTSLDQPPRQLVGRKLFTAQCSVYGLPVHADAWEDAPWVVLGPPLHASPLGRWERARARRTRVAVATASRLTLNRLVAAGVGLGAIPHLLAREYPELVEVEALRTDSPDLKLPVWLLTHPDLRGTSAVKAVMQVLGDALIALGRTQPRSKRRDVDDCAACFRERGVQAGADAHGAVEIDVDDAGKALGSVFATTALDGAGGVDQDVQPIRELG